MARRLNIPLPEAGYVGEDVEYLLKLLQAGNFDVGGLSGESSLTGSTKWLIKRRTRQSLVTSPVRASSRLCSRFSRGQWPRCLPKVDKHPQQDFTEIDTTNVLFIVRRATPVWRTSSPSGSVLVVGIQQ